MTPDLLNPLTTLALDWGRIGVGGTIVLFIAVCLILVLTILIQKPQGGGLSGAFGAGSSGSGQTAFGTKTGDALTFITVSIFVVYLGAAIAMNFVMRPPSVAKPAPAVVPVAPAGAAVPQSGTTAPDVKVIDVKPAPAESGTANPASPAPANPVPAPANPAPVNPAQVNPVPSPVPAATPAPTPGPSQPR